MRMRTKLVGRSLTMPLALNSYLAMGLESGNVPHSFNKTSAPLISEALF